MYKTSTSGLGASREKSSVLAGKKTGCGIYHWLARESADHLAQRLCSSQTEEFLTERHQRLFHLI
jgi:hypothetical protein